ncbi:hypothetical protein [Candidatus Parabeggiatoa sp. HSG14]|uniref:slr1659 superfamily regulator n=1 Tax=Candidatus Parabeggiatoa sp. HSG14 TaxID=3055593 RepID=UPI0025A7CDF1|nr:hypothetical protein [Thiotrichales bacterium HSG14]
MEITTEDYSIKYDAETATIHCQGIIRLNGKEYEPIMQLLDQVATLEPTLITINLKELKALNSSGVTLLGKFVFAINRKKDIQMIMQGSQQIAWQKKSVKNFQRLMPKLQFEWE